VGVVCKVLECEIGNGYRGFVGLVGVWGVDM